MSNKTPNASHVKTVLARSLSKHALLVLFLILSITALFYFTITRWPTKTANTFCAHYEQQSQGESLKSTSGRKCNLTLERAETELLREKGLSGRAGLARNRGMLFVFDRVGKYCMWMKDMRFSIDIAWLDINGKVIKVEENVSPNTYPRDYCSDNTMFVIETAPGTLRANGFTVGTFVDRSEF